MMLGSQRFYINLIVLGLALWFIAPPTVESAEPRRKNRLVVATSAEDPALIERIVQLGPGIDPNEARRIASVAYHTGLELKREWRVGASPTVHNFLIKVAARKYGYCFQWAEELAKRLAPLKLKTVELHWGESDVGTQTEHNVIVVTARGQPFAEGIMLDNWRRSGRLLWGPLDGDPSHTWTENRAEFAARSARIGLPPTPGLR